MPTKLKNLKVTKVDFVDSGANPEANILIYKNTPNSDGSEPKNLFQKAITALKEVFAVESDDTTIVKNNDAETFDDKIVQLSMREASSEIWDFCYLFSDSLCSILYDAGKTSDEKAELMKRSLNEFTQTTGQAISSWSSGNPSSIEKEKTAISTDNISIAMSAKERLDALIEKAVGAKKASQNEKGVSKDMIDKSKLTPEEIAYLDDIEKKAATPHVSGAELLSDEFLIGEPPVAKFATAIVDNDEDSDIYKGLHPAIKAELEELRKRSDAIEEKELLSVAKKYEIIGKKPEELAPVLKSLKDAGGTAYDDMLSILDASVAAVEKSGIFSEIGKSGGNATTDAWESIEKCADEIQKAAPTLNRAEAITKACEQHPELVREYEDNR